jgi:hypothetical protein
MDDHTTHEPRRTLDEEVTGVVQDFLSIGRSWARYGLNAGKHALVNSARTLELTADALGRLAVVLGPQNEGEAKPEAGEENVSEPSQAASDSDAV